MLSQKAILPDPHTMMAGKPTLRWEWLKKIQNTVSSQAPAANAMAYVTNGMPQFSKSRKRHEHTKSAGTTRYRVRKGSFEHFATTMNSVDARNVPHRRASSKEEEGYERTLVKNSPESMSELRATSSMRNMATNRRTRVPVFCAGRFRRKPLGRLSALCCVCACVACAPSSKGEPPLPLASRGAPTHSAKADKGTNATKNAFAAKGGSRRRR